MEKNNKFKKEVGKHWYYNRYLVLSKLIRERLLNGKTDEDKTLADSLKKAGVNIETIELSHIGNLLALHIENKFKCKESAWDKYLQGDLDSLNDIQKKELFSFMEKGVVPLATLENSFQILITIQSDPLKEVLLPIVEKEI